VAVAADLGSAYRLAFEADPLSAFGGVVAVNGLVDGPLAEVIVANPLADVLVAPAFAEAALELFAGRRKNMRVLEMSTPGEPQLSIRQIDGGWLVQQPDRLGSTRADWRVVTKAVPTKEQWQDLELAWLVCARTTSNAIVLAVGGQVNGIGCGQQSRVEAAQLARARRRAGRQAEQRRATPSSPSGTASTSWRTPAWQLSPNRAARFMTRRSWWQQTSVASPWC